MLRFNSNKLNRGATEAAPFDVAPETSPLAPIFHSRQGRLHMSISQRPDRHNAWWIDIRVDGRRARRRSPVQTLEGTLEFETTMRRQLETGSEPEDLLPMSCRSTFAEFAERWMTDYVAVANRASTKREKRYALDSRLLPAFGAMRLEEITTNIVDAQVAQWMRAGLGMKRINNLMTVLRKALRCAEEWHILDRAPLIRHHRYFPPVPQYLTSAESNRLLQAASPGFWRTFMLFMLKTGARFGETAALRWEDFELDANRPHVRIRRSVWGGVVSATKTNASRRTVALIPELVIALRALKYERPNTEWVFTSPSGKFYHPGYCGHVLKRACRKAGVPVISWHKLRHSCATQLLANGVPLPAIKEVLGHTNIDVTCIYTHVAPGMAWDYMQTLSTPRPGSVRRRPTPHRSTVGRLRNDEAGHVSGAPL